ncbi:hypothetical protein [Clostridium arbusti]|nr:hypothetical protein [Clostridium arbusti]
MNKILDYEKKYDEIVKAGLKEDYARNIEFSSTSRNKIKFSNIKVKIF